MGWLEFIAAWIVFFLSHSVPIRPPVRPWLEARLGQRGFTLAYSLLSLAILFWLIAAAGRAPYVALWHWADWQRHVPLTVMLPVCIIIALTIGRPNPFSFGGAHRERFDPERAGIVRVSRHPLLLALALWAGAHLVANGDLAHVILFGVFTLFAAFGGRLIDRRRKREMGPDWQRLRRETTARLSHARPASWTGAALRILVGIALYVFLIWLHPWLFGVSPLG
ncbi:NnrU family protein [Marivita sp. GX14005]|uniref:NnrU family protein n=1 Tax=Marivita sp. GX14005 TaxID=2942276 RepID=UPI002019627A|nr:NnrU family protein [Marivita sp. GX14005]MCL3881072.1 NnrU family protein [Marivita sp. GX14005]